MGSLESPKSPDQSMPRITIPVPRREPNDPARIRQGTDTAAVSPESATGICRPANRASRSVIGPGSRKRAHSRRSAWPSLSAGQSWPRRRSGISAWALRCQGCQPAGGSQSAGGPVPVSGHRRQGLPLAGLRHRPKPPPIPPAASGRSPISPATGTDQSPHVTARCYRLPHASCSRAAARLTLSPVIVAAVRRGAWAADPGVCAEPGQPALATQPDGSARALMSAAGTGCNRPPGKPAGRWRTGCPGSPAGRSRRLLAVPVGLALRL
jgi:hypothetical protein